MPYQCEVHHAGLFAANNPTIAQNTAEAPACTEQQEWCPFLAGHAVQPSVPLYFAETLQKIECILPGGSMAGRHTVQRCRSRPNAHRHTNAPSHGAGPPAPGQPHRIIGNLT